MMVGYPVVVVVKHVKSVVVASVGIRFAVP